MKKLFVIALVVVLASCATPKLATKDVYFLDFRPYAEKGFLMSTTNIGEKYVSIGELSLVCNSGYTLEKNSKESGQWQNDIYSGTYVSVDRKEPKKLWTVNEVLEELYNEAVKVGANGIINIDLRTEKVGIYTDFNVSGLAIKTTR